MFEVRSVTDLIKTFHSLRETAQIINVPIFTYLKLL